MQAYKANGVKFPDRMTSRSLSCNPKRYGFVEIPLKQASPGDVMWNKGHVAIMYDGKNVIEASQTKGKTEFKQLGIEIKTLLVLLGMLEDNMGEFDANKLKDVISNIAYRLCIISYIFKYSSC